jgi:hypothetical protein
MTSLILPKPIKALVGLSMALLLSVTSLLTWSPPSQASGTNDIIYHANVPAGQTATATNFFTGSPLTYVVTGTTGSTVTLFTAVAANLTIPDHMFVGWNTAANGSGTAYDCLNTVQGVCGSGESITLNSDSCRSVTRTSLVNTNSLNVSVRVKLVS